MKNIRNSHEAAMRGRTPSSLSEFEFALRLHKVNLDLLPVLHELLRTKSVTRTAQAFNMTQPAVSRALHKLRGVFDDQLLASRGSNAKLTERAEALRGPLTRALADLDIVLTPATPFNPATEAEHIVINTADYVIQLLAPILSEICAREAPRIVVEFTLGATRSPDDLGKVDFLIAPRSLGDTLGKRVGRLPLWRDEMVCIAAAANASISARISPAEFKAARYAAFRRELRVPQELSLLAQPTSRLETAPVCTVPTFLALGAIVERSDCIALVPRKVAHALMPAQQLRIAEIAYPRRQVFIDAYWSSASEGRRGRKWFRNLLARAAVQLE
jgi:DNA-binding transcriptional LysR family regulator